MKHFKLFLLFLVFSLTIYGQKPTNLETLKKIEDLENELSKETNDSIKIEILTQLFQIHSPFDISKAKRYNEKQFEIAKSTQNNFSYCKAYFMKGFYHYYISEFDSVVLSMNKALTFAEKAKNQNMTTSINGRLGSVYLMLNKNDSALHYIEKTIDLSKKNKDTINIAQMYLEKGNLYLKEQKLEEAITNYLVVDSLLSTGKNKNNFILITSLLNISSLYVKLTNYDKATTYALRTKQMAQAIGHIEIEMASLTTLGRIDFYRKNYTAAIKKFETGLNYYKSVKNKYRQADMFFLLGMAYGEQNKIQQAKEFYQKAISLRREISDINGLNGSLQNLAAMYFQEKNYSESKKLYTETLEIARTHNNLQDEVNSLKQLAEINYLTNNFQEASKLYSAYIPLNDSLIDRRNFEKVTQIETQYQTKQKEQEIQLLTSQNQLTEQQKKNQRNLYLGGLTLAVLTGGFFFFQYRNKQKTNRKLKELDTAKSTFFANISHEFRTPLTLIKGPIEDQINHKNTTPKQKKNLQFAINNTNRLQNLVEQLLALSKLESGQFKLKVQEGNIEQYLSALCQSFAFPCAEKNIHYSINIKANENESWFDVDALTKIVYNLLGNALKYTPENETIKVQAQRDNTLFIFTIENTGNPIAEANSDLIFTRFYQVDSKNTGTGIGLALTKELVELHKGTIEVASTAKSTQFTLKLPIDKASFDPSQRLSQEIEAPNFDAPLQVELIAENEITSNENAPILLIAEDNIEISNYLCSLFEDTYQVHTATNGNEALESAIKNIPDIIISDVMMPQMDGLQFTKKIKEHQLTAHIPVLLLTAKTDDIDKLKAAEIGADSYMTKPFNSSLLKKSINNLLENRRKIQKRYAQEIILTPKEIAVSSADEKFIERLQKVLDTQLTNTDFTAVDFSEAMGVSRMQLHRKLKALTGQSSTEFIKLQRLKLAVTLLKEKKISISEIGYSVGFNDPSYFTKCFKAQFGVSPSDYII